MVGGIDTKAHAQFTSGINLRASSTTPLIPLAFSTLITIRIIRGNSYFSSASYGQYC